jgi:hypothetical protein
MAGFPAPPAAPEGAPGWPHVIPHRNHAKAHTGALPATRSDLRPVSFPRISGVPRAPAIKIRGFAPAPQNQPQNVRLDLSAVALAKAEAAPPPVSMPAQARAPPAPIRETPKPLSKQGEPAGLIGRGFRAAKERLTQPCERSKPPPPKEKEKETGGGMFRKAALALIVRIARRAKSAPGGEAVKKPAAVVKWLQDCLEKMRAEDAEPLDNHNPASADYLAINSGDEGNFEAGFNASAAPSLHL